MSISAGIVALLLIIWRQLSHKYIPSKFYYLLWATVLFRLVVPFSLKSGISLLNLLETSNSQMQGNRYVVMMEYIDVADVYGKVVVNSIDIMTVVSVLWAVVAVAMIAVWIAFFVFNLDSCFIQSCESLYESNPFFWFGLGSVFGYQICV